MTMDLHQVQVYAHKMVMDGTNRNIAFDAYRQMYHSGWDLPPTIRNIEWVQKVINADCYDAIQTGMRILATIPPSVSFQPLAPGQANKDRAGIIETVLKWNLMAANQRVSRTIESEIAKNALLYDLVALQVTDLEYQVKEKKRLSLDTKSEELALSRGRFMVTPFDSRSVFPEWSNMGLEKVLIMQHKHASELIAEWGEAALQFPDLVDLANKPYGMDWVSYYDYWDINTRSSWAAQGQRWEVPYAEGTQKWVLTHGENPLPFLPFAIRGGTMTEIDTTHQFQPLLYPVYATGAWDIRNLVRSLEVSEVVAHTGSPRLVEEGPNQQQAMIDYMSPDRVAKMPSGNTLRQIQPGAIDAALANVDALLGAGIHKSTISEVLQGGDLPSGTAFATLNLMTQTAVGVLKPYKFLSEMTLADMFVIMLKYGDFTGKNIIGYGTSKEAAGENYEILADEIEPNAVYIKVELHPDTPTDRGQKINAAGMAVQQLNMSLETALSEVGIEDPALEMKNRASEMIMEHEMQLQFTRENLELAAEIELKTQAALMQIEFQMQQAAQAAAEQNQPQQPGQTPQGQPQEGNEFEELGPGGGFGAGQEGGPGGQGFNPAEGGQPPAGVAPGDQAEGSGRPMAPEGGGQMI